MTILYKKMRLDLVMAVVINILRKIFICGTECFIKVRLRASSGRIIITTCMETITAISCARIFALLIPPYPWARKQRTDPNSRQECGYIISPSQKNTKNYWRKHQHQTNDQVRSMRFYFAYLFGKQFSLSVIYALRNVLSTPPCIKQPWQGKEYATKCEAGEYPHIAFFKSANNTNQHRTQYDGKCNEQIRRVRLNCAHSVNSIREIEKPRYTNFTAIASLI